MSKQTINIGASPNDGTGTPLRTSFDYTNQNFTELYTALGGGVGLPGATTQVIFNDGGTNLAGDAGLVYNKTTDALTVAGLVTAGSATISGDLTVDTSTLKVDSANNRVGIGTASPSYILEVVAPAGDNIVSTFRSGDATAANNAGGGFRSISSATAASRVAQVWLDADGANFSGGDYFYIQKNGNSGTVEFNQSSNAAMTFLTNGTERMRIDSSGNVGIGVTPSAWSGVTAGAFETSGGATLYSYGTDNFNLAQNAFYNSVGGLSDKYIRNGTATRYYQAAGSHQWFNAPAGTAGNAITFTSAMTLTATGALLVGCTTAPNPGGATTVSGFAVNGSGNDAYISQKIDNGPCGYFRREGTDGAVFGFYKASSQVGTISVTTTATAYNTSSDYRLKEAAQPLVGGLARVNALKPSIYKWKADGSAGEGFIAHELAETVPFAVTGDKDAVDADGKPAYQGVDLSKIVPILVAAIQELTAEVNALKNA